MVRMDEDDRWARLHMMKETRRIKEEHRWSQMKHNVLGALMTLAVLAAILAIIGCVQIAKLLFGG